MYEIRRILLNKKTVISFLIMFILNMFMLWNETNNEGYYDEKSHTAYINAYSHKYDMVRENARLLLTGKEYSGRDSFSARNINKTLKDFAVVESIEITDTDEMAADRLLNFKFTDYAMIVFVVCIVMSMYDERKKSIWSYVYSTKNGRKKLALKKLYTLAAGVGAAAFLMYMTNVVYMVMKYGTLGDIGRAAQSNENFENLIIKISLGEALAIIWLIKVCVIIFIGIALWLLISNMAVQILPFFIFGGIMFMQYYSYSATDIHSGWKNIKYINIFGILDSKEMLGTYINLNIFGYAVNRIEFISIFLVSLLVLFSFMMIYMGKRRPFIVKKRIKALGMFQRSGCTLAHEFYKALITQKMWIILILYFICAYMLTRSNEIMYDYSMVIYNQYMEKLSGDITKQKLEYLSNEISLWEGQLEELMKNKEDISDSYELGNMSEKIKNIEAAKNVTEAIYQEGLELEELKEAGSNVGFVSIIGFDRLMGEGSKEAAKIDALIILAFMILTVGTFLSFDNQSGMRDVINSCVNGRGKYIAAKYATGAVFVMAAVAVMFIFRYMKVNNEYGIDNLSLSIKSIEYFRDNIPNMPIGVFLGAFVLIRCINSFFIGVIIMYISSKAKNNVISIVINMAVFLLPACMYYIGMDIFAYSSVTDSIGVSGMWESRSIINTGFVVRQAVIMMLGIGVGVWHLCGTKIQKIKKIS